MLTSDERFFKFYNGSISIRLSSIRPKVGRFKEDEIVVHDSFYDQEDRFLLLVSYKDETNYFWLTEKQLKAARNTDFNSEIDAQREKYFSRKNSKEVYKNCEKKARTKGILISSSNCGIITGYKEIFGSESLTQTSAFCCELINYYASWPKYLVYDNSCKLRKFVHENNGFNRETERSQKLISTAFIIDRFYFESHAVTDTYCYEHCDANKYNE